MCGPPRKFNYKERDEVEAHSRFSALRHNDYSVPGCRCVCGSEKNSVSHPTHRRLYSPPVKLNKRVSTGYLGFVLRCTWTCLTAIRMRRFKSGSFSAASQMNKHCSFTLWSLSLSYDEYMYKRKSQVTMKLDLVWLAVLGRITDSVLKNSNHVLSLLLIPYINKSAYKAHHSQKAHGDSTGPDFPGIMYEQKKRNLRRDSSKKVPLHIWRNWAEWGTFFLTSRSFFISKL